MQISVKHLNVETKIGNFWMDSNASDRRETAGWRSPDVVSLNGPRSYSNFTQNSH